MYCAADRSKDDTLYHKFHLHLFLIIVTKSKQCLVAATIYTLAAVYLPLALSLNHSLIEGQHPTYQHLRW